MLHQTKGIVFHSLKYSESSLIVKIYTELFGLQSYLFRGIRSSKSKTKPGLFQPLTLLELVVYHKEKHSLQSVKEIRLSHPFHMIPFDIRKSSVALFIDELLYRSIREEEANPDLFEFIWESCLLLDSIEEPVTNFHLIFALQLAIHLGITPQQNHDSGSPIFNLREGLFQKSVPDHPHYLDPENSKVFLALLNTPLPMQSSLEFKPDVRSGLLETILLYYRLHLPGFKGLKSHHILHTVLS